MVQIFYPVNRRRCWRVRQGMRYLRSLLALAVLAGWAGGAFGQSLLLELGDLEGPDWKAHEVRVALNIGGASTVQIGELKALGRTYTRLSLTCTRLLMNSGVTRCEDGMLQAPEKMPVVFIYSPARRSLLLMLTPEAGERWVIDLTAGVASMQLENASLARLAPWIPGDLLPNAGRVSGSARFAPLTAHADLLFKQAGFSDPQGLHAGEKLGGKFSIDAQRAREPDPWTWNAAASWDEGAVFWDPLYLSNAGHTIVGEGEYANNRLNVRSFTAEWPHLGKIAGNFNLNLTTKRFERVSVAGKGLRLTALRELIPQDWLDHHDLADLKLAGSADLEWRQTGNDIERISLKVAGAGVDAAARKLQLKGLDVALDYDQAHPGTLNIAMAELRLRDLSAGPIKTAGEFRDGRLTIPSIIVPVVDGVFILNDIAVAGIRGQGDFSAELRGAFTPLSMARLTSGLQLLPMTGTISAVIPKMSYAKSTLSVDGALLFKVFDGDAVLDGIRLEEPFGKTPRLTANLHLHGMDLEQATGAVKFGSITGKLDVDVDQLVMENWQPLSFNARVLTTPGDFKKRISQRAVQNISSIGGAGAGAAIEASFLRVVQSFGYDKIGLSCKLAGGICELGGAENAAQGFYIIKGGGIPSVSVVGYNRRVGWQELLDRIRAVIAGNSKMVIK